MKLTQEIVKEAIAKINRNATIINLPTTPDWHHATIMELTDILVGMTRLEDLTYNVWVEADPYYAMDIDNLIRIIKQYTRPLDSIAITIEDEYDEIGIWHGWHQKDGKFLCVDAEDHIYGAGIGLEEVLNDMAQQPAQAQV